MLILDLCGGTGAWSEPYRAAGYSVCLVTLPERDVRCYDKQTLQQFRSHVRGVLAAPPCTEFARVGARWWKDKPPHLLAEAIDVVRACLQIIDLVRPRWWALENPIGRLPACVPELGQPVLKCDPCDFGDPWTKKIWLWGEFAAPAFNRVEPVFHPMQPPRRRDRTSMLSSSAKVERSRTSSAFARAFFEANP
jgi:hypothetical protein